MRGAGKMTAETYLMYGDDGIADRNDADEPDGVAHFSFGAACVRRLSCV